MALLLAVGSLLATNLLPNPELDLTRPGWDALYTRKPETGEVEKSAGPSGNPAVHVLYRGTDDWALASQPRIPVQEGDRFELSTWMKFQGSGEASASLVTRDASGQVLDWAYAPVRMTGHREWARVSRRFLTPRGVASVQFRFGGYQAGEAWFASPSLAPLPRIVVRPERPLELKAGQTSLVLNPTGSISLLDAGQRWSLRDLPAGYSLTGMRKVGPAEGQFTLQDLGNDRSFSGRVLLRKDHSFEVRLSGNPELQEDLPFPGSVETHAKDWLILPMNEGIGFPVEDATVPTFDLITYGGHGLSMPWYGITDMTTGKGLMSCIETPDDAMVRTERVGGRLTARAMWQPSRGRLRYPRTVSYRAFSKGGYVAMAKAYRAIAEKKGLVKTLRAKAKFAPQVDRLIGAVNVWNWDMDVVEVGQRLKQEGFDRLLWSRGGNPKEIQTLNSLGFLTGKYDIYQDVWDPKIAKDWMPRDGWPDDLVLLPDGDWMRGWAHPDTQPDGSVKWLQGGVICSPRGLARAKQLIPKELKDHPYGARFIDTTTASPWRECYNPKHPLTRSEDRVAKMALLDFCSKDERLVVGTETGIDPSVPYVHYYEGMLSLGPFRLPDAGTDILGYRKPTPDFLKYQVGSFYRLPLWELVYHDCTVAQWYWGDATNKAPEVWDQRDLLNILYGTAPLLIFDKERFERQLPRMRQTYQTVCNWHRKVGYDEMVTHAFLTADHLVQRTRFSSGREVVVNFGERPWNGIVPHGFRISEKGGRSKTPSPNRGR